jgi:hypothetical protein
MNVIGHTSDPKTFAIQLPRRARQIRVQRVGSLFRYRRLAVFRAEDEMHQVEAQRLRHGDDYMSGFQPSSCLAIRDLGLRPRLVFGRTCGPQVTAHLEQSRSLFGTNMNNNQRNTLTETEILWATLAGEGTTTVLGNPGGAIFTTHLHHPSPQ